MKRIDTFGDKPGSCGMVKEGLRVVIHPNFLQAPMAGSDGKSPPNTIVFRTNGSPLNLEDYSIIHSTVSH